MTLVFYNEWEQKTASWLRELTVHDHLPSGTIDTRSITELKAEDLHNYDQAHFFAGIGGWPLAIRWAGLEHRSSIWTGSPPCQPFSTAGRQEGVSDERHLAPVWLRLIQQCRPSIVFGEQVEAAIRHGWLDDLFTELEEAGYACGAAVLPACSAGAPHLRKRIFFGAVRLADLHSNGQPEGREIRPVQPEPDVEYGGDIGCVAHANDQPQPAAGDEKGPESAGRAGPSGWLADPNDQGPQRRPGVPECADQLPTGTGGLAGGSAHQNHSGWADADWLGCRDGKIRPVEPGTFPLADGVPARVGRLRGYGNAIVPQVAAGFIRSFMGAVGEMRI